MTVNAYVKLHAHGDLTSLTPHERLPEILVVPREKTPTGAAPNTERMKRIRNFDSLLLPVSNISKYLCLDWHFQETIGGKRQPWCL